MSDENPNILMALIQYRFPPPVKNTMYDMVNKSKSGSSLMPGRKPITSYVIPISTGAVIFRHTEIASYTYTCVILDFALKICTNSLLNILLSRNEACTTESNSGKLSAPFHFLIGSLAQSFPAWPLSLCPTSCNLFTFI